MYKRQPQFFVQTVQPYIEAYNDEHPDAKMNYDWQRATDNSWLWSMVPYLVLIIGMGALWFFMFKQANGGGKMSQFGKANMKNPVQMGKKTTFAEVAGADEEKEELAEIVEFLKYPKKMCIRDSSIGVGRGEETLMQSEVSARQALDMALGRGGDQAVIKNKTLYEFYGGVSKGVEKRTKVKTCLLYTSLQHLWAESF